MGYETVALIDGPVTDICEYVNTVMCLLVQWNIFWPDK
jgi:hypothetical protein